MVVRKTIDFKELGLSEVIRSRVKSLQVGHFRFKLVSTDLIALYPFTDLIALYPFGKRGLSAAPFFT